MKGIPAANTAAATVIAETTVNMKLILGIELGSTRIKAVLCNENGKVLSSGSYEWENSLAGGLWSYSLEQAKEGLQASYKQLADSYKKPIEKLDAIGISGMMHGYLAFGKDGKLLAPFRTWRNTNTGEAAEKLSELFNFNVPMRWSVSQYYQSFLDKLDHVKDVDFLTTLAGYAHYKLTGKRVIGADDASGMFPLNGDDYDGEMLAKFNAITGRDFKRLLPKVLLAGENAGTLTTEGALLLDPTGTLKAGAIFCPPEGDMGTGMVCANAVKPKTGQVSSGTCANLTVILEKPLKNYYPEIDVIATPDGHPAAMIHTNNCTTEINEWVNLFSEVSKLCGGKIEKDELFTRLFNKSTESDKDVGGLTGYNFLAGEPQAHTVNGAPLIVRTPDGKLNLANFMQMQIYSAIAALSLSTDILEKEEVRIDSVTAHGGFYKTEFVGQSATSAVLGAPVTVMENAGEGGALGIALLAGYALDNELSLPEYLDKIFADTKKKTVTADDKERAKCRAFLERYKKYLQTERLASEVK